MRKFKVGDKLVMIKDDCFGKGKLVTVPEVDYEDDLLPYFCKSGEERHWVTADSVAKADSGAEEKPRFRIGQRVRIRSRESMKEEFGLDEDGDIPTFNNFVRWMKPLCGRTATIKSIEGKNVSLEGWSDDSGDTHWEFSTDMLEPAEKFEVGQIYCVGKLSHLHEWEDAIIRLVEKQMSGFKIKSIRGEAPADFMSGSEYARSLTLLTGKEIGEAIRKYDAEHSKPGVREVKRHAKIGDTIKVLHDCGGFVKPGTVWSVTDITESGNISIANKRYGGGFVCGVGNYAVLNSGKRIYSASEVASAKAFVLDTIRDLAEKDVHVIFSHSSGCEDDNSAFSCYVLDHDTIVDADEDTFRASAVRHNSICSGHDEPSEWIGKAVALCKALHKLLPDYVR